MITPTITQAGLTRALNNQSAGMAFTINKIALGKGKRAITEETTRLQHVMESCAIAQVEKIEHNHLRLTSESNSEQAFPVHEMGFYLEDGSLFAAWSDKKPLLFKSQGLQVIFTLDLVFTTDKAKAINLQHLAPTFNLNLTEALIKIVNTQTVLVKAQLSHLLSQLPF